jgi:hypothetical protein
MAHVVMSNSNLYPGEILTQLKTTPLLQMTGDQLWANATHCSRLY